MPFLDAFCEGLARQTDRRYALWVGLDDVLPADAVALERAGVGVTWTVAGSGESPVRLRARVLAAATSRHDGVVLLDSDDVPHPDRVAQARRGLADADVAACAMDLVDESGADLGRRFSLPAEIGAERILPFANAFGFGNSAYRSSVLAACLPVPDGVVAMDWLVACRAALRGASFAFDAESGLDYRLHRGSTTRVLPPFDPRQIRRDAARVAAHHRHVLASPSLRPALRAPFKRAAHAALPFLERLRNEPEAAEAHARALARRTRSIFLWWEHLAPEGWQTA